jgi:hypothetical protein
MAISSVLPTSEPQTHLSFSDYVFSARGDGRAAFATPETPSLTEEQVLIYRELGRRAGIQASSTILVCLKVIGLLDLPSLRIAFHALIQRHNAFQTVFTRNLSIPADEWSGLPATFIRTGILPRNLFIRRLVDSAGPDLREYDLRGLTAENQAETTHIQIERAASGRMFSLQLIAIVFQRHFDELCARLNVELSEELA